MQLYLSGLTHGRIKQALYKPIYFDGWLFTF